MTRQGAENPRHLIKRTAAVIGGAALVAGAAYFAEIGALDALQIAQPHILGLENFNYLPTRDITDVFTNIVLPFSITGMGGAFAVPLLHYARTGRQLVI